MKYHVVQLCLKKQLLIAEVNIAKPEVISSWRLHFGLDRPLNLHEFNVDLDEVSSNLKFQLQNN